MATSMHIAPHARGKIEEDNIFKVGAKARAAKTQFGSGRVIDGSIGLLLDESGELALLPAVELASERVPIAQFAPYAPIAGVPHFREDVTSYILGSLPEQQPKGAVATAGATGAVRLAIWNFLESGDSLVTHDYYWSPYRAIARDTLRNLDLFETYGPDRKFNVGGALAKVEESLDRQNKALLIINTPCHNPTGICLADDESDALKKGLVALAERNPQKPIIFLVDGAYWEFGGKENNDRLVSKFHDLPDNLVFTVAYSLSKSMTRYGFRVGALLVTASKQQVVDDVVGTMTSSIRATWSNTTRIGQEIFSVIYRDPALRAQLASEQDQFAELCNSRGKTFIEEALEVDLPHTPYKSGFFVTLPTESAKDVADRLFEQNIFLVPMAKGVRVAFCAIPSHQIPGLAAKIREHFF